MFTGTSPTVHTPEFKPPDKVLASWQETFRGKKGESETDTSVLFESETFAKNAGE
jgi:hypothetical protein